MCLMSVANQKPFIVYCKPKERVLKADVSKKSKISSYFNRNLAWQHCATPPFCTHRIGDTVVCICDISGRTVGQPVQSALHRAALPSFSVDLAWRLSCIGCSVVVIVCYTFQNGEFYKIL